MRSQDGELQDRGPRLGGRVLALLALLAALGVWLRTEKLGQWPIDGDEIYTIAAGGLSVSREPLDASDRDAVRWYRATTPLFYLLNLAPFAALGASPLAARVVPWSAGLLALLILPLWVRRLYGRRAAAVALALLALSPAHIELSRFGRYQSLTYLFGAMCMLAAVEAVRCAGAVRLLRVALWGGCCAASHVTGTVLLGWTLLYTFAARMRRRDWVWVSGLALTLALAAYLGPSREVLAVIRERFTYTGLRAPHWKSFASLVYNQGPLLCLAACAGGVYAVARRRRATAAIVAGTALPLITMLLLSCAVRIGARFLSSAEAGITLLATLGLEEMFRARLPRAVPGALAVLLCAAQVPLILSNRVDAQRFDWVSVARHVQRQAGPRDWVFAKGHMVLDHYLEQRTFETPHDIESFERTLAGAGSRGVFLAIRKQRGRRELPGWDPAFEPWLERRAELLATYGKRRWDDRVYRFEIELYRLRAPPR